MATVLSVGDIAIVQYNSSTTDSFTFVFGRDVEAGTVVNFTDNGWLATGGFRPGEGTVIYTAPTGGITAGTIVTLTGLDLDDAGDQIIAYQGTEASPTILYVVDLADGNNTVAGDATNDNTTALPPGFTLGVNAVAVGFDNAIYAGPIDGSAPQLFPLISNSANWIDSDALSPASPSFRYFYHPVLDLDLNNSTSLGDDYRAEFTPGGGAVSISDTDSDIDDFDGLFISAAWFDIKGQQFGDVLSVNGTLPFGIFASPYDPSTGILTLFGYGSHADYQTAIEQIRFSTTAPVGTQKTIAVWVFDGYFWSNEADAFITVTSAAVPPVLDLDANNSNGGGADYTATFTSGGLGIPVADADVSITDADSTTIQSATITIAINRQSGDALIAGALPPGITASSYNPFTGVITLSGAASLADYQTALRQVVFDTTSISTSDRIIQVTVNDGTSDSNVGTTYMHVVVPAPNVPPALDLDANDSTTPDANYLTKFTDGGLAVAVVDTDVSVVDNDSPLLASATVTLTNPDTDDVLEFNGLAPGSIIVSGSGTSVITLTGAVSAADYQTALRQITFDNTGTTPSTDTRIINIVVYDGASNSNTAQAFIQVEVVNNSAPVLDLDPNDSGGSTFATFQSAFTENGAPVPIADVDTSITDLDSTHLEFATITLTNPQTGDLLTVSGLPGTITPIAYNPGTGVLTLTGQATLDEYETALKQIRYSNTSDDPATQDRVIEVVVNDGANESNVAAAVISVTATNDAPVITVAPSAAYVENAAAVVLAPLATLLDLDDTQLNGAVVGITDGSFSGDGDTLSVGGVTNGTVNGITFQWMPTQHVLVFGGASLVANYQALLQQVQFQSSSDNPTNFNASPQRALTWAVNDGTTVTTATTTIDITAVNDAPQETVAATAAYTENGAPVTISPAATASDVDSSNLVFGEVRIVAGGFDGDVLTVNGLQSGTFAGPSGGQIDFSYDAGSRSLTFHGPAAVTDYQALMQAVQFGSTSENPTNFGANPTRTLGWVLYDGEDYTSPAQTTQITITALNDAPINTVPGGQTVNEDSILPIVGVSVADIDSSALTTTLSVLSGKLDVTASTGAVVTNNGTASVIITGTAAQINAALVGLTYTGNLNFNGADTLTVATNDGTATDTDMIAITVNAVNDAPINTVPAAQSVAEDATLLIAGVSVADIDSSTLTTTLSVAHGTLNVTAGTGVITGNGTAIVSIAGTAAQINTALAGLTYTGNLNFNGADTLTVATNDDATATDTDTIAITVNPVNDAPINTVPVAQSVAEDATLLIAGVSVADIDSSALTTTLSVAHGTLNVTGGAGVGGNGTASVTITGSATQINTALAGLTYTGNPNFNGADTLTVATNDGTATDTDTIAITVNAVNDPPINTVPAAQSVAEDTILPIVGVSVADVDSSPLTTTLSVSSGKINVTAGAGVGGNGTASVTITGTAAQINAALVGLTYTGNPDFNGADTLTVATSDGTATDTDTIAITVNAVNDAPINTVPAAQSVAEDTTLPIAGVLVADIDSSTLTTTLNVSSGILNVTAGPGVSGNGTASVIIAGTAAEINAALAGLAYTGNLNFNGADTLTVTTSDGAATDTDTIAITVNPVNDAPINTVPPAQSIAEDTTLPIAGVSVADIDSSALTTTLSVSSGILNVTAGPGVSGNGTANVTIAGTAAQINAALAGLAYTGNLNFNGADTLTVATSDGTATDTDTIAITVNAVNDAPINTVPAAQSVAEDTILPIAGVSVADIDSSALTATLSVSSGILNVTAGPGVTGNGTANVTIAGTAAEINAALAGLAYTGNPDFNGTDTLTVTTSDGTLTDTDTIAIAVNPVNDPPALNLDANSSTIGGVDYLTTFTGSAVAIVDTDVSVIDNDSPTLASATVTLTNPQALDSLTFNGPPPGSISVAGSGTSEITLTSTGAASAADYQAALQQIVFNTTDPSTETRIINVVVNDGTADSNIAHAIVEVIHVNDSAPTLDLDGDNSTLPGGDNSPLPGTSYHTTFTENGTPVAIADIDTLIGDPDIGSTDIASATITLTNPQAGDLLTATGSLPPGITASAYNPVTGTLTLSNVASFADYETALESIRFSAAGDTPVAGNRIIQVVVNDGINDSQPAISLVTVVAVNDPPINTVPTAQTAAEDTTLSIVGVSVADSDSSALTTTLSVANGILNVTAGLGAGVGGNGTDSVTIAGTAAQINAALADLAYTGNLNFNGADTLTVATSDGAATDTDTIAITVNAVNDAPINTVPGGQSVAEETILPIAGVSVADIDSSALTTTLSVSSGILNVIAGPGVTGNGTANVTIAGTAAEINAALVGLAYTGNLNFNGADTLTVTTSDGAATDTDTIAITVNPVNDAPALVVADATYQENAAPVLLSPALNLTDADDTELNFAAVQITAGSFPGDGDTLTVNGVTSGTVNGITFTWNPTLHALVFGGASSVANYQALLQTVQFQSTSDNPTDFDASPQRTLTWFVSDGAAVTTATTTLDIVAANDAPINTVPPAQTAAEDTTLSIAGVLVADSDSSALTTTLSVSSGILSVIAGTGVTDNGTAFVTITGTAVQINAALAGLTYTGNPDFNGADTLTVVTSDGTDTDTDMIAITVNPVNDAPINTVPSAQSVAEETILPIAGVLVADSDSSALTTTLSVSSGILNVTSGAGVTDNGTAFVTITGTAVQINAALAGLTYTGNPDFNGADTLTVVTSDGTATDTDTIAITVNPVNDAPALVVADATYQENAVPVLLSPSASLTDADDTELDRAAVWITAGSLPGDTLTANGATSGTVNGIMFNWMPTLHALVLTGASSVANYQALLQTVAFQSTSDNPTPQRTLTWFVSDGTAVTTATTTLDIVAVNDAPINTVPGGQSLAEDTILPIVSVSVADVDSSALTTTLSVTNGILNVTTGPGAVVTGNGTDFVTIAGTAAEINTALAGLAYAGNPDFKGGDTLTVVTSDGTATDTDMIAITVNAIAPAPWIFIASGDFNGDGTHDVLWQDPITGDTIEWLMSPNGGVGSIPPTPPAGGWNLVAAGDFNGDGIHDLMWKNAATGATSEWLMSPNGGIGSNPSTPATGGWDVIATGDFNGDGTTDIMWKTATGGITSEWLMSPNGGIGSNPTSIPATPGWDVIATGDFNGDGTTDLMWKTATGGITSEWLMSPNGGIGSNPTSIPATPGWDVIATGDFNGDGTTDLMWKTATGGITSEWLMSPDGGILSNPTSIPATAGWDVIATGDFNGDGTTDIMWKTATGGITSEWLMSPDGGILSNPTSIPATPGWDVIATGDTDVFWKTATDGLTSEWLMSPDGGLLTNPAGTPATGGYDVVATGVFNGDGTTDILWKTAPGLTSEWLMSAAGGLGTNPATPLAAGTPPLAGTVHDFPFV